MKIKTKDLVLVSLFAALTAVGAFIRIPIPYVPFTLQVFFVVFSGLILGSKKGALSQLLYVLIGLSGIPVFSQGGGITYVFKPSFGYLIGFIFASFIIGFISERIKEINPVKAFLSIIPGLLVIYLFGVSYLSLILNLYLGQAKGMSWAIYNGCIIFMAGDIISCVIAAIVASKVLKILKKV